MTCSHRLLYAVLWLVILAAVLMELHAVLSAWQRLVP